MKKIILMSLLLAAVLSSASCNHSKKDTNVNPEQGTETTNTVEAEDVNVDKLLDQFENNMTQWSMLTNDVFTNGDAMIHYEELNANIIKKLEENPQIMTKEQKERYHELRTKYKEITGY